MERDCERRRSPAAAKPVRADTCRRAQVLRRPASDASRSLEDSQSGISLVLKRGLDVATPYKPFAILLISISKQVTRLISAQ